MGILLGEPTADRTQTMLWQDCIGHLDDYPLNLQQYQDI